MTAVGLESGAGARIRFATFVDAIRRHAEDRPDKLALLFLRDGEREEARLSYEELDRKARAVAVEILSLVEPGDRVLLLYPPGLDFVVAFLGCLYAGAVAVPSYAPRLNRSDPRMEAMLDNAEPALAMTTSPILDRLAKSLRRKSSEIRSCASDTIEDGQAERYRAPAIDSQTLAFLQYTSGSTSTPKGVMVSHANLVHNEEIIRTACRHDQDSVFVSWLPLFHDMGLIGGVLQPLYLGASGHLMSPVSFLQRPRVWLEAITRYGAHTSGAPNFAYELCRRKIPVEEREGLDLSSWRVAFNGAEPVRAETIGAFAAEFGPWGLRRSALYPCYGLAEATLFVTGGSKDEPAAVVAVSQEALGENRVVFGGDGDLRLVSCGVPWLHQEVAIVHPETRSRAADGEVGEIWVRGGSVAGGYWNRPEDTRRDFGARLEGAAGEATYLRTGDLGFLHGGELFVTGRLKDLVIIRGRNYYPQDLELTAERSHPAIRPGCGAAFSVEVAGEERLVVVYEIARGATGEAPAIVDAVRGAISEEHELRAHDVVLARVGTVPKTTSGKIQRRACRARYLAGELVVVGHGRARVDEAGSDDEAPAPSVDELGSLGVAERRSALEAHLLLEAARILKVSAGSLAPDRRLSTYGLDSLAATELRNAVEVRFGVSVDMAWLVESPTLGEIVDRVLAELDDPAARRRAPSLEGVAAGPEIPLSYGQSALWFLDRLEPGNAAYVIAGAARLKGALATDALTGSLVGLARRHPALRTTFGARGGEPYQRILPEPAPDVRLEDVTSRAESEVRSMLHGAAFEPFDLERGPLFRALLLRRAPDEHLMVLSFHHIVADFWSLGVLLSELGTLYREHGHRDAELPSPPSSYVDYVHWQRRMLSSAEGKRLEDYWCRRLESCPRHLELPSDRPRPPLQSFRGASLAARWGRRLRRDLSEAAKASGVTLFMSLLAAYQVLLRRYGGQEDFAVGAPVSGRVSADLADVVGYFANPLALRAELGGAPTFAELLGRVRRTVLEAFVHQDYPFPLLVERLVPERDPSRAPLFQVMLVFHKARRPAEQGLAGFALGEEGARLALGDLVLESVPLEQPAAQFDLTLTVADEREELTASIRYNTDLYDATSVRRLAGHLEVLLESVVREPERRVTEIALLSAAETHQLLVEHNDTDSDLPETPGMAELFTLQAERAPAAAALWWNDTTITYGELASRAEDLARRLRASGVERESIAGIAMDRTPDLVTAMLAVWKAGGAYLPIDPAYPEDRQAFMLKDARARVLLVDGAAAEDGGGPWRTLPGMKTLPGMRVMPAGAARRRATTRVPGPAAVPTLPDQLALVIYTSGSTGLPKGVAIRHSSVVALVRWSCDVFPAEDLRGLLAATSVCFDLSTFELFVPLCRGGRVILAPDVLALPALPARHWVTLLNTVPSAMAELVRAKAVPPSVRTVNLAGEPLKRHLVEAIYRSGNVRRIWNLYGPSEDTTYSTAAEIAPGAEGEPSIGRAVAGTRAYVLDGGTRPVPAGVAGELHLAGRGLARGYLGRPALTAGRFLPDPHGGVLGRRLYRTGDRVRRRGDGELDFLGRVDHQVKVRGFRIELGEIEARLAALAGVREAVVAVRPDPRGDPRLVAYVAAENEAAGAEALRRDLRRVLPGFMVPEAFVALAALPLTPNGKVDRRALPEPVWGGGVRAAGTMPRTPIEELLAGIWAEVLEIPEAPVDESFFALGGHSLLATRVMARIEASAGVDLPVRALFELPTVAALATRVEEELARGRRSLPPLVPLGRDGGPLELSHAQERLFFLEQLEPAGAVYNVPVAVRLRGRLSWPAFARAVQEIGRRHEALRTTFPWVGAKPMQVIAPTPVPLLVVDHRALEEGDHEARRSAAREAERGFDLGRGPLVRLFAWRFADEEHVVLLVMHHIVTDGWSIGVFFRELAALYTAFAAGRPSPLPEPALQYADYAAWQRGCLDAEALTAALEYWRDKLEGAPGVLELPADRPRPAVQSFRGALAPLAPAGAGEEVRALARLRGVTVFMTLLAGLSALLSRLSRQRDLVVGSPIAHRRPVETEGMIGFFVNTVPLRMDLADDPRFDEMLARARETALEAYAHQDLPFERLIDELRPERSLSHSPVFQVMVAYQNATWTPDAMPGLAPELLPVDRRTSRFDVTCDWLDLGGELSGSWEYNRDLFDPTTIGRWSEAFRTLFAAALGGPATRLSHLPLLGAAGRAQLVVQWNDTGRAAPAADSVLELFEARAAALGDAVAVVRGTDRLSYGELDGRAERLGRALASQGVGPETTVALVLERSPRLVTAVLGVFKAGGAYLPLDPVQPRDRLAFLLKDSRAPIVLTRGGLRQDLAPAAAAPRVIDLEAAPESAGSRLRGAARRARPQDLAYVIYTSGSTGRPKGTALQHDGLVNLVDWHRRTHGTGPSDRTTLLAGPGFDASVWELWSALTAGASLHIPPERIVASPSQLLAWLADEGVTESFLPTPLAAAVLAEPPPSHLCLRRLLTGGDRLLRGAGEGTRFTLVNHYGPTENTVVTTATAVDGPASAPPIGRPIAAMSVLVVDARLELRPLGAPGELVIGSAGLARGYLHRPALTAERIVPDPYAADRGPGARLYRTGDLVHHRRDGQIVFLGRLDHQVKIRGFRIELGEIEAALAGHPSLLEAAVSVHDVGPQDRRLVAYVVANPSRRVDDAELRRDLAERLPEYMVPRVFVELRALPLSPNGKVDRRRLPAPEWSRTEKTDAGPRTPTEEILANIWTDVLGVGGVGRDDDFFALGGHSLFATQVISRVRRHFGAELPVRKVFEAPTLSAFGRAIDAARGTSPAAAPARIAGRGARAPLSFAQERLWLIDQLDPGQAVYNVPAAVELRGDLRAAVLAAALDEIVRRHEALRTRFPLVEGGAVQDIVPRLRLALPRIDLRRLPPCVRVETAGRLAREEARRPFVLERGPLLRARLLQLADGEHRLLFTLHHIVSDGWSTGVLLRELAALYGAGRSGAASPLRELPLQYADYAVWQRRRLAAAAPERALGYWRRRLAGAPAVLDLPADRPRRSGPSRRGATETFLLPAALTAGIAELARRRGATLFMTLLAALKALLLRWTGQRDLVVGTPVAHRDHAETEALIGFFVNTLALRTDLSSVPGHASGSSFEELLDLVREVCLDGFAHQELPFERLVEELKPDRSLSHTPFFQVFMALQNAPRAPVELPGLAVRVLELESGTSKFDLSLSLEEDGEGLRGRLTYAPDLFDASTIRRLSGHYARLLQGAAADRGLRLGALPLFSAAQRSQLLSEWNDGDRPPPPAEPFVDDLIGRESRRRPDALAVVSEDRALTYGELDRRAERWGGELRRLSVGPETLVGLCCERSPEMVVGLLAVWKAGGAYLPIDPGMPAERIRFQLDDARVRLVAGTGGVLAGRPDLAAGGRTVVCLDGALPGARRPGTFARPPESLAYVIYTSGSTGRPKGVEVEHRHLSAYLAAFRHRAKLAEAWSYATVSTVAADLGNTSIFAALAAGGTLHVLADSRIRDPEAMADYAASRAVDVLKITPSHLSALLRVPEPGRVLPRRKVIVAGEAADSALVRTVLAHLPPGGLINSYGPTETTVGMVTHTFAGSEGPSESLPLGRPIPGNRVHLLDAAGRPVPIGAHGELVIAGGQVSRGYLRRPGLTAERFVPDDFGGPPGARVYRSGDLARYRGDGRLLFLGRIDRQVKIRGHRVETGEIEAALEALATVRAAAVVLRLDGPGEPRLVAYVVDRGEEGRADAEQMRDHLRRRLPDYMVPAAFVVLPAFPLTANGKVDRRALPAPPAPAGRAHAASRTALEEVLAGLWSEILGLPDVGSTESFFDLGGHSLLATRLVSQVRRELGVELSLRSLFEAPTIEGQVAAVEAALKGGRAPSPPLVRAPREGDLPLSFAQERQWFLDQLAPERATYNLPYFVTLEGALDVAALGRALAEVVRRHEVLRTRFPRRRGRPVQVVETSSAVALAVADLTALPAATRGHEAARWTAAAARRPFDLARGPLLRAALVRLGPKEHRFLLTLHHIVSDGWSRGILARELGAIYNAFVAGELPRLPELELQYADYSVWQRGWLRGEALGEQLGYWRRLAGVPAAELPADRRRPTRPSGRGAELRRILPPELLQAIASLARGRRATLFMTLAAALDALLLRVTGQTDLALGTPIANRNRAELEGMIGFFVNTLVLRADLAGDPPFTELLDRVREVSLGAFAHQDMPFEKLVEELRPERSLSRSPFFQVFFAVQNAPGEELELRDVTARRLDVGTGTAKFDLSLALEETAGALATTLEYALDLFDPTTCRRLLRWYETLLAGLVEPGRRLSELPLTTAPERHQVVMEWRGEPAAERGSQTLHGLVEAQVRRTPDAVAVRRGATIRTYADLRRRADRLAHRLRSAGVGPGRLAAVCLERTPSLPVALLAVLKAGGAYVPLDPAYPADRLAFTLADAEAAVVVTERSLAGATAGSSVPAILVDEAPPGAAGSAFAVPGATSRDLAYVIYTSGSTGRPKGVAIEHRSAAAFVEWAGEVFGPEELSAVLAATSICFDLSVFELFVPLARGGSVVLADNVLALAERPEAEEWRVSLLNTVPSAMAELVRSGRVPASVRTVNLAGEPLHRHLARQIYDVGTVERLYNLYGPSEDTTYSTFELVPRSGEPSIGRPVAGTSASVLDARGRPVPIGVAGELCLGGGGLARGYLRRPGRTAQRFVPDPRSPGPGSRLYRTGDLVRCSADGRIHFLGRSDHQVKIRGFRIETGEIEVVLESHPALEEAAVVTHEDLTGERRLTAYVVPAAGASIEIRDLRDHLAAKLPEFMVPWAFVPLQKLPRLPNGKLDRRALPAPERPSSRAVEEGSRDPVEELLSGFWSEVLGLDGIAPDDHFFELGGHSLLATRVVSRIRDTLGADLPLMSFFEAPTLAQQARLVAAARSGGTGARAPVRPVPRGGELPLTASQERLWFLDQLDPGNPVYNMQAAVRFSGPFSVAAARRSLAELVGRHEILRTTFRNSGGRPVQVIGDRAGIDLPAVDLGGLEPAAGERVFEKIRRADAAAPFDLARGPLLRAILLRFADESHVILFNLHHIVTDGWSMGILIRELGELYGAFRQGESSPLPALAVQYADYAVWQRERLTGELLERQLDYWRRRLAGPPEALELPSDRPRPAARSFDGVTVSLHLDASVRGALEALGRRLGATLFMTLLAAFEALLGRLSGQSDFCVGTPVAGRNHVETEGLVGFFLNSLVLRADLSGAPSFREVVERVRKTALEAYDSQDVPFERLLEELKPPRDLSRTPLFQVFFNMLDLPGGGMRLEDLEIEPLTLPAEHAKFDLTLYVKPRDRGLDFHLVYNADLFDAARAETFLEQLEGLLRQAVAEPEARIAAYTLVTPRARRALPDPRAELDSRWLGAVHEVFARRAAEHPTRPAVIDSRVTFDYGELEALANGLAHDLTAAGVARGDAVVIYAHRSAALVWALLGTLKAGAAFVALDPTYPAPRLVDIVRRVRPAGWIVLAQAGEPPGELEAELSRSVRCRVVLPGGPAPGARREPAAPPIAVGPDDLAYVAFTSGSTGVPKGIRGRHGSLSHFIPWLSEAFGLGARDRYSLLSGLAHDPLHRDVFTPLQTGAAVVVPDSESIGEPGWLAAWMRRERVSVAHLTPAMGQLLTVPAAFESGDRIDSLRLAFFVGDVLTRREVARFESLAPRVRVINFYGSTESQRAVAFHPVDDLAAEPREALPLGRGIPDVQLLVLNSEGRLAGVGELGEVAIRSPHLALGYLGDPESSAERFVVNPFTGDPADRIYRTGDLGRYLPDGEVVFAGRNDHQVKIRGFRIELPEIEAVLAGHPGIREAVVLAREDTPGEKRLVGYLVAADELPAPAALRDYVRKRLPEFMVPLFVFLDELPLTPNRKIDRRALPPPPATESCAAAAPESPLEQALAAIWSEVVGRTVATLDADFFELGGHSLSATRLMSRVRERFGVDLPVRSLFEGPTLGAQAAHLELAIRGSADGPPPLEPAPRNGADLPLSHAQQRLWLVHQFDPASPAYNMPVALHLEGPLDVAALAGAFTEIVRRHETLRTTFPATDAGEPMQVIAPPRPVVLPVVDLGGLPEERSRRELERLGLTQSRLPFDLSRGPVMRLLLVSLAAAEHALLAAVHHIASDAWSTGILAREVSLLYGSLIRGLPSPLPELPIQYADYAVWQRAWLRGDVLEKQLGYWRRLLQGARPLRLPADRARPAQPSFRGASLPFRLPKPLGAELDELARREGATLFMILLAAFEVLLHRWTGEDDLVVVTPVAGRNHRSIEGLIGFFVNNLALRMDLSGNPSFRALLARVRDVTLGAYAHQDLPFDLLVAELRPDRQARDVPFLRVIFNFQNVPDRALTMPGLKLRQLRPDIAMAKVDLAVILSEADGEIFGTWNYSTDLFDADRIARWSAQYASVLESACRTPTLRLSQLEMLKMDQKSESRNTNVSKLKGLRRRSAERSPARLVDTSYPADGIGLPLMFTPLVQDLDLAGWAGGNREEVDAALLKHGALLFRGFGKGSVVEFERFARTVSADLYGDYGDLPPDEEGEKVYHSTPYPADKTILFHNESSHMHRWPRKQFFCCIKAASERGETPLVDCREIYRRLDRSLIEEFERKNLLYVRHFIEGIDVSWQKFFKTEDRGEVERKCRASGLQWSWDGDRLETRQLAPAVIRHPLSEEPSFFNQIQLHHPACLEPEVRASLREIMGEDKMPRSVTFGDGTPIADDVVTEITRLYWDCSVALPWQEGDVIMVDNMLCAHARNPFSGERKIVVAMGEMVDARDVAWGTAVPVS